MNDSQAMPELDELVEAYVAERQLEPEQIERALASVHAKIAASSTGAPPPRSSKWWWWAGGASVVVAVVLARLLQGSPHETTHETEIEAPAPVEPEVAAVARPAPATTEPTEPTEPPEPTEPTEPPEPAEPTESAEPPESADEPPTAPAPEPPRQTETREPKPKSKSKREPEQEPEPEQKPRDDDASSLRAELELMRDARQALRGSNYGRALELLEEHERRFPASQFADERATSKATARCELRLSKGEACP